MLSDTGSKTASYRLAALRPLREPMLWGNLLVAAGRTTLQEVSRGLTLVAQERQRMPTSTPESSDGPPGRVLPFRR